MILEIDPDSPVPPYEQIRSQVATMAASRVLPEGTRLPAIRQLAADLGVAGGTVARAYRELEQQGLIITRGRHGTFVEAASPSRRATEALHSAARAFVVQAKQLGVDRDSAVDCVRHAFEAIEAGRTR